MTEFMIRNLRPQVAERLQRLAELQGLALDAVVAEALGIGVGAIEERVRKHLLTTREQVALKEAIDEIQKVPDDTFGMIGRVNRSG